MKITPETFAKARANLSMFILKKADQVQRNVGFGYRDVPDAPNNYADLLTAWRKSKQTGLALPVWDGGSDKTVYDNPGVNFAFRFWHDSLHCMHGLTFKTSDEITIGIMQTADVSAYFGADSIESKIMYADTVLQSQYYQRHKEFVNDQYAFVEMHVMHPEIAELWDAALVAY